MSNYAVSLVFRQDIKPATRKLVLLALADYCGEALEAWPAISTLCRKTSLNRKTVMKALTELQQAGSIEDTGRRVGETGQIKVYRLKSEAEFETVPKTEPFRSRPQRVRSRPERVPKTGHVTLNNPTQPFLLTHEEEANRESIHHCFVRMWHEAYLEHFGETYAFQTGKDGTAVKQLLAQSKKSPRELIAIAVDAWKRPQGFYSKSAASISGFHSKFNEIRQEIKHGSNQKTTTESSRNVGTANEGKSAQYEGVGKVR